MDGCKMRDKINEAIALRYQAEEDHAPLIVAKGKGEIAEAILKLAQQSGVPTLKDPELVKLLEGVEVGEYIPPEAYALAAEIIAFIWRLEEKIGKEK